MPFVSVEIHDVCPPAAREVDILLDLVESLGARRPTLLVVPEMQDPEGRRWPLSSDPSLCRRLARLQEAGAEIVLHGLHHRALTGPPPGLGPWLLHHAVSRGEAEFAHLSEATAAACLEAGLAELARCGLSTQGFIPPVWQLSPGARRALAHSGLCFTADLRQVYFLHAQPPAGAARSLREGAPPRAVPSPALTYCAPGPGIDHAKRWVMRAVAAHATTSPLVRVALHPEDARVPGRLAHIRRQLARLLAARRPWRYRDGPAPLLAEAA